MLCNLTIKNVALIDYVEIEFSRGLNILSGETGAGKSVILDSLNFVLGAKADKTMIRHGQQECMVTCLFSDLPDCVKTILDEYDIECCNELLIKRKFDINGNGYIKLNGENVTATMLRKITSDLVDVHGQSEHFSLLSKTKQLECIDFGANLSAELSELSNLVSQLNEDEKQLSSLGGDAQERYKKIDLLQFQINEIEIAELKKGEKEDLIARKNKLLNLEKLYTALNSANNALGGENGATDLIISAAHALRSISDVDKESEELLNRLNSAREEISDISESIVDILDTLDSSEESIDEIEHRLELYHSFARKYGNSYEEICEYLSNAISQRDKLINFEENYSKMIENIKNLRQKIFSLTEKISTKRKKFAAEFTKKVTAKLAELGMPSAKFEIFFEKIPPIDEIKSFSRTGLDKIEFLFSANAGVPVKPLSKIISGGEMSRFMLALKTQLSVTSRTYIFDEIDAGISGITAGIVAKQFALISKNKQVIAISHLPQIAAMADNSFLIRKCEEKNATYTKIQKLDAKTKIEEILRLIGGSINDSVALMHAKKMIEEAECYKSTI